MTAVVLTWSWLTSPAAEAFEQTMTCYDTSPNACEPGQQAFPVAWPRGCVGYQINEAGTTKVADTDAGLSPALERAVTDSFDTWNQVDCSRAHFRYEGRTAVSDAEFNQEAGTANTNLIVWREHNWRSVSSAQTIALTTVSYDPASGEIGDADIEINAQYFRYSTTDPVEDNHVDLRNTLVHEVGHFLGLDHSAPPAATMHASADIGETSKRTLEADDRAGVCHIYPIVDGLASACDPAFPDDYPADHNDSGGSDQSCAATPAGGPPGGAAWLLAAGVILVARRRRQIRPVRAVGQRHKGRL